MIFIINGSVWRGAFFLGGTVNMDKNKGEIQAAMESKSDQIRLTAEHKVILEQFRKFDGRHLSSGELHEFTNIEPIKISAILADLMAHGLLHHTASDEAGRGWMYILTDYGRKFVLEHAPGNDM